MFEMQVTTLCHDIAEKHDPALHRLVGDASEPPRLQVLLYALFVMSSYHNMPSDRIHHTTLLPPTQMTLQRFPQHMRIS